MDISPILFELAEGWYTRYIQYQQNKKLPIRLHYPLSAYKKTLSTLNKHMRHLAYDEKRLVLFLFASMTHQNSQLNLWEIVRFFHRHPFRQINFLSRLLASTNPLYRENWIILQGGWPPENQLGEFFSFSEYISSVYRHTLSLNIIGYSKLIQTIFFSSKNILLPFFIKKKYYTTLSAFLQDIQILFSNLKFYKTLLNETLLPSPQVPWFEMQPFADMIETIKINLNLGSRMEEYFSYGIDSVLSCLFDENMKKMRQIWIFYFYLVYLAFIRQETQQSIEHTIQMLTILPEEISLVLSFFRPDSPFMKTKLIKLVSRDFFEEAEEETSEESNEESIPILSKNFELNKQLFLQLINFFLSRNEKLKKTLFYPALSESPESSPEITSSELEDKIELDWLFGDTASVKETALQKENTTSVLVVEKKETLYEIVKPNINLSKIILDEDVKQELLNAVDMTKTMKILKKWGVKPSLSQKEASSVKILLYGISGTGKTITAQALAGEAHAKLFKVDASNLVSSFVGESTKNVKRVFEEYYNYVKNAKDNVFFFINEADQLLSSRGMIHQAADKEYNQMQNLLLEEIENFRGVFIATTNLIELFDVAWNRRFNIKIRFDIPRYDTRLKLWQVHISEKMPLAPDVNLEKLAGYELAGGSIANVVYNAARKAAARTGSDQIITQKDFLDAIEKEMKSILGLSSKRVGFNR